jgi:hypothetical protein
MLILRHAPGSDEPLTEEPNVADEEKITCARRQDCNEIVMVVRPKRIISKQNRSNRLTCNMLKRGSRVENFVNASEPTVELENRHTRKSIVGSNPSLSAIDNQSDGRVFEQLRFPSPLLWQIAVWQEIGRKLCRTRRNMPSFRKLTHLCHNIFRLSPHLHTVEVRGSNPLAPTIFSTTYQTACRGVAGNGRKLWPTEARQHRRLPSPRPPHHPDFR